MLNNIVDNIKQCGQQNIAQFCFHLILVMVFFPVALTPVSVIWRDCVCVIFGDPVTRNISLINKL